MPEINEIAAKQIEVIRQGCEKIKPLVAIYCITYNHEPYIREALEGFVMQKTNFPFIAVVHDDASTDGTATIIREYTEKYPAIIKPIIENENQYSKHNGSVGKVMKRAVELSGAKYIAMCEGDDYWVDSLKLQKQIDFMEAHPDYSMCFHRISSTGYYQRKDNAFDSVKTKEYSAKDLLGKWIVHTSAIVYRSEFMKFIPSHPDFCVGDNVLLATCIHYGKIYAFEDIMGVYRRTDEGWTLRNRKNHNVLSSTNEQLIKHYKMLNSFFPDLKKYYEKRIIDLVAAQTLCSLKYRDKSLFMIFWKGIKDYKVRYIQSLIRQITHHLLRGCLT